jgi:hypothetical protein
VPSKQPQDSGSLQPSVKAAAKVETTTSIDKISNGALPDEQLDEVSAGSQSSGAGAGKVTFNPF